MAGDAMDEAIVQYVKHTYNLLIGTYTGEIVKLALGSALLERAPRSMPVRGRDMLSGLPKIVVLTSTEVYEALQESLRVIVETVLAALERTPPELSADIIDRGIIMTGGGALLPGLDRRLRAAIGLPVTVADDPLFSVVRGVNRLLEDLHLLQRVAL
jgi:rod shape-determining protein MreB